MVCPNHNWEAKASFKLFRCKTGKSWFRPTCLFSFWSAQHSRPTLGAVASGGRLKKLIYRSKPCLVNPLKPIVYDSSLLLDRSLWLVNAGITHNLRSASVTVVGVMSDLKIGCRTQHNNTWSIADLACRLRNCNLVVCSIINWTFIIELWPEAIFSGIEETFLLACYWNEMKWICHYCIGKGTLAPFILGLLIPDCFFPVSSSLCRHFWSQSAGGAVARVFHNRIYSPGKAFLCHAWNHTIFTRPSLSVIRFSDCFEPGFLED